MGGIKDAGFGTTINIINGAKECGKGGDEEEAKVQNRIKYYKAFRKQFGIDTITESDASMGCKDQEEFPDGSAGSQYGYFVKGSAGKCVITKGQTEYSIYTPDDYKRC